MARRKLNFIWVFFLVCGHGGAFASERKDIDLQIQVIEPDGQIHVSLASPSDGPRRIWKPANSWGASNWRVLVIRGHDLFAFREDPDQNFSRNFPAYEELRGAKTVTLNLKGEDWIGPSSTLGTLREGDLVVVIYEVPTTPEARRDGVWYGTVSTLAAVVTTD